MQGLRKVNILAGLLHLFQMAAVLALSSDFALPVTATYISQVTKRMRVCK